MNPGWLLLADPSRGDRLWHEIVETEHVEDGWKLTASCGREMVMPMAGDRAESPPAGEAICHACAEVSATSR